MHVATIASEIDISLACKAQIVLLKIEEAFLTILTKYSDFADVFSKKLAAMLLEYTQINTNAIDLKEG